MERRGKGKNDPQSRKRDVICQSDFSHETRNLLALCRSTRRFSEESVTSTAVAVKSNYGPVEWVVDFCAIDELDELWSVKWEYVGECYINVVE